MMENKDATDTPRLSSDHPNNSGESGTTSLDIEEATTLITVGAASIIASTIKDRVPQHGLKAVSHH